MLRPAEQIRPSERGFTLIELMIALVVGLIVSGAAVALVAAIGKSNADTVRATRLTQELRASAEIIARDMRRARSDLDPIANVSTSNAKMETACNTVDISTAGCVVYAYDCAYDSSGTFTGATFNAVGWAGNKVYLNASTAAAPACPTTSNIKISSDAVNIVAITDSTNPCYDSAHTTTGFWITQIGSTDAYTIHLNGELAYKPSVINSVTITNPTRCISQEVRIRSALVK